MCPESKVLWGLLLPSLGLQGPGLAAGPHTITQKYLKNRNRPHGIMQVLLNASERRRWS
jgi:hypothetical protein